MRKLVIDIWKNFRQRGQNQYYKVEIHRRYQLKSAGIENKVEYIMYFGPNYGNVGVSHVLFFLIWLIYIPILVWFLKFMYSISLLILSIYFFLLFLISFHLLLLYPVFIVSLFDFSSFSIFLLQYSYVYLSSYTKDV